MVFFAAWAGVEQHRLSSGYPVHVRTAPVDPRDLLRGQYLALSYEFSAIAAADGPGPDAEGGRGGVGRAPLRRRVLCPDGAYARRPAALGRAGWRSSGRSDGWRIRYGIEEYYVPEGSPTPAQSDTTVRLRVGGDGKPRIEAVMVR